MRALLGEKVVVTSASVSVNFKMDVESMLPFSFSVPLLSLGLACGFANPGGRRAKDDSFGHERCVDVNERAKVVIVLPHQLVEVVGWVNDETEPVEIGSESVGVNCVESPEGDLLRRGVRTM